jgi:hypothetical protein
MTRTIVEWLITLFRSEDFLFLNGDVWAQLWSGVFGSIIGAVAATAVALFVVVLSNNHQSKLAAAALHEQQRLAAQAIYEQRSLADAAMTEQRRQADLALSEQREALQLQLSEQKAEASRERQYSAISQFLAAANHGSNNYRTGEGLQDVLTQMESAVLRWGLDMDSTQFRDEARHWPTSIWQMMHAAHLQHALASEGRIPGNPYPRLRLNKGIAVITTAIMQWLEADPMHRTDILRIVRTEREKLDAQTFEFVSGLPRRNE